MIARRLAALILLSFAAFSPAQDVTKGTGRADATALAGTIVYRHIHAIFIGVNNFDLHFAENDALGVRQILIDKFGFKPEDCKLVLGSAATKEAIEDAIADMANDQVVGPGDAIFIFLSGHGVSVQRNGISRGWFVPYGAKMSLNEQNPRVLDREAVSYEFIDDKLNLSLARHVFIVADSCVAGNLLITKGDPTGGFGPAENFAHVGREVLAATDHTSASREVADLRHGFFSFHFIAALEALASSQSSFYGWDLRSQMKDRATSGNQSPIYGWLPASDGGTFLFRSTAFRVRTPDLTPPASAPADPVERPTVPTSPASFRVRNLEDAEQAFYGGRWVEAVGVLEGAAAAGNARAATLRAIIHDRLNDQDQKLTDQAYMDLAAKDPVAKYETALSLINDSKRSRWGWEMMVRALKDLRERAATTTDPLELLYVAGSYAFQWERPDYDSYLAAMGVPGASLTKAQSDQEAVKYYRRAAQSGQLLPLNCLSDALKTVGDKEGQKSVDSAIDSILKQQAAGGDLPAFMAMARRLPEEKIVPELLERFARLSPDLAYQVGKGLDGAEDNVKPDRVFSECSSVLSEELKGYVLTSSFTFGTRVAFMTVGRVRFRDFHVPAAGADYFEEYRKRHTSAAALPWLKLAAHHGHGEAAYEVAMRLSANDPPPALPV